MWYNAFKLEKKHFFEGNFMNAALMTSSKYCFSFSVAYFFGYAYFAFVKFIDKLKCKF